MAKLCICMKKIISGKHVGSAVEETEAFTNNNLLQEADLCFRLLRKTNEESDTKQRVSQFLEHTLLVLEDIVKRFRLASSLYNFEEVELDDECLQQAG